MEEFLKSLETFIDTREIDVRGMNRIHSETLRNIDDEQVRQIERNVKDYIYSETREDCSAEAILRYYVVLRLLRVCCDSFITRIRW
jgi:hypothetical protein